MLAIQSTPKPRSHGWTLIELLVVLVVLAVVLTAFNFGPSARARHKAIQINCATNLRLIGRAFHIWAADHGGKFPMEVSVTQGGTRELPGTEGWRNFQLLSNTLPTPNLFICYGDNQHHQPATNFGIGLKNRISYFIGLNASTNRPSAWLAGDDNFEINRVPIKSGLVELKTYTPLSWSAARHIRMGNLLLVDGSVQFSYNTNISKQFSNTGLATNRIAVP